MCCRDLPCLLQESGTGAGTGIPQLFYTWRDFGTEPSGQFSNCFPRFSSYFVAGHPWGLQLFPRPPGYPTILSWSLLGARTLARHDDDDDDEGDDDEHRVACDGAK